MDDAGPAVPVSRPGSDGDAPAEAKAPASSTPRRRRRLLAAGIAALVIIAGTAAYFLTHRPPDPTEQNSTFIRQVTAAMGRAPTNPAQLIAAARTQCNSNAAELSYLASLIHANNNTTVATMTRIGISVYCPDRSGEFEQDLKQ